MNSSNARSDLAPSHRRIWPDLAIPEPSMPSESLLSASRCQHSLKPSERLSEALRASLSAFGGSSTFAWSSISKVHPARILHRRICPDLRIAEPPMPSESLMSASRCPDSYKPLQRPTEALRTPLRALTIDRGSNTNTTLDIYLTTS